MLVLNLLLGTLVVTIGFWLLWGSAVPVILVGWALTAGCFLWWKVRCISEVWAWSTLLLGLESVAWPILLMSQLNSGSATPSEEEMGTMLSAVVLGLFASVFWISFSYGLFKRTWGGAPASPAPSDPRTIKQKQSR